MTELVEWAKTNDQGVDEFVDKYKTKFRFKRLKDRKPAESWILMIYGPSKTGKSYTAGTAGGRTLYVNIGDGIDTLMMPDFTKKYGNLVDEMITVDVREAATADQAFDMVCLAIDEALEKFPDQFDWIILDEATAFRNFAKNRAMVINKRSEGGIRNRQSKFIKTEIDDFGVEMDMVNWFLGKYIPIFKEAKKHFCMLAHERQLFNKATKPGEEQTLKRIIPGFTGKTFPDLVPAYFDDVFHSEVRKAGSNYIYFLRTRGDDGRVGGSRHGGIFEDEIRNPNLQTMLTQIQTIQR